MLGIDSGVSSTTGVEPGRVASDLVPIPPPSHVLSAFGLVGSVPESLPGGRGQAFRCGDAVLKPVDNPSEAAWLASTFEHLRVTGVRVARPIRASDGRWVVAGWCAQRFVSGAPEPRYDEIIEASLAFHEATADVAEPRFLSGRDDLYSRADRLSWGEAAEDGVFGEGHGARLYATLAGGRRPVTATSQLVHRDLFGNVLFVGAALPGIIDLTPSWRPASWAAAVIAVDALSWGGASIELLTEWNDLPDWPQMIRRALLFRLAVSLSHPRTTPSSMVDILSAAEVIEPFLD